MAEGSQAQYGVRHVKDVAVPTRDGTLLSADLFFPDGPGAEGPFPAILEYLPYRKDDSTAPRWDTHHYFARRGYVGVRLDVRGTGGSAGRAEDEYTPIEQLDGYDAIEWLAAQPWCNGKVGMWGTSYGGFNCIQVAMHRPPHLAAIAPHAATDDRYNDDVHYWGGCLQGIELLTYPLRMVAMNALPTVVERGGADWAARWEEHLASPPWLLEWLSHQLEDDYWLQGSLKADYSAIACPTFHIGGWNDGYTNAVFRMAARMAAPYKALVGPWTHARPNMGYAGPQIDFLYELGRWWDYWLKGLDTGIMDEPPLTIYVQRGRTPDRFPATIDGEWRYEAAWPRARARDWPLYLGAGALDEARPPEEGSDEYRHLPTLGTQAGKWCPTSPPSGLATDQRTDNALSLCYDSAPVAEDVEILGTPVAALHLASDAPVAFCSVKLCDVAPDGASTLISRGILNLTRRDGMDRATPLTPDAVYAVGIPLKVCSWVVRAGHRLRLAVAAADFPTAWPSPYPATNRLHRGGATPSAITIPVVPPPATPLPAPQLRPATPLPSTAQVSGPPPFWETRRDEWARATTVRLGGSGRTAPLGASFALEHAWEVTMSVADDAPASCAMTGREHYALEEPSATTTATAHATIQGAAEALHVQLDLRVERNGTPIVQRHWVETIPRRLL
jgi:putative CocE/NonD family hydrolase